MKQSPRVLDFLLKLVAIFAFGLPAMASASPAPPSNPAGTAIVITGRAKAVLRSFVEALTQSGPTDQIARWKDVICPAVIGIDPAQAEFVAQRIIETGRSVGLRPGRSSCLTTMAIIVTTDPAGFTNELAREYPVTLRTDGSARLKAFLADTSAVRWLSVTNECGEACVLPNSRLTKATKPAFQAMIVIVDARAIVGVSLGELSDYVALVALSNPPANARAAPRSILSMFGRPRVSGVPYALTDYDRAFLAGLYGVALDSGAQAQRSSIASRMRKELEQPPKARDRSAPRNRRMR